MQPTYRWRRDPGTHVVPFCLPAATLQLAEYQLAVAEVSTSLRQRWRLIGRVLRIRRGRLDPAS